MIFPTTPRPYTLRCPRCSQDTVASDIFTDMDLVHLRPGIATCSQCGARFTYRLAGFRVFFAGISAFVLLSVIALRGLDDPPSSYSLLLPVACLVSVLIGAFGLTLGGLELVE